MFYFKYRINHKTQTQFRVIPFEPYGFKNTKSYMFCFLFKLLVAFIQFIFNFNH